MRIPMLHCVLLVATPALLLATATMATEQAAMTPAASAARAESAAPPAPAPEPSGDRPATASEAEENPVVCKRVAVTGSRVKREKICKTQREWDVYNQRAKEFMRGVERGGSHQPGGQGLSSGG